MDHLRTINHYTRECYNRIADKYHELFKNEILEKEFDRELLNKFAKSFDKDALICDAGCGPSAHIGRYLFDKGLKVIGTDISDRCIEIARNYNPGMDFYRVDFLDWPFPEKYFDGIISFYSIIYTPQEYVNEIMTIFRKALKTNGKLLLVVKEGTGGGYIGEVLGIPTKVYFTNFTKDEITNHLINNGFTVEYLYTREPLSFEIDVKRLYAIGIKID